MVENTTPDPVQALAPDPIDYSDVLQEIVNAVKDKATYEVVNLPSGDLRVIHEITQGDIIIAVSVVALIAVIVAKWIWEAAR